VDPRGEVILCPSVVRVILVNDPTKSKAQAVAVAVVYARAPWADQRSDLDRQG